MAVVAGSALIDISRDAFVLIIHVGLIMLVAENTFEDFIIIRINVTIGAEVPYSLVPARKNREI